MSFYSTIWDLSPRDRTRISAGLLTLRDQLAGKLGIPPKTVEHNLLLATWNIREFGGSKYERSPDSYYFIAEIINHFDLVAVQEVREDLGALKRVMKILGNWWKYMVTDVTLGQAGNHERLAFLYDSRKVQFDGLAGQIVLPPEKKRNVRQMARAPFICGFRAGWTRFEICTAHIYYGTSKSEDPTRLKEIATLADLLATRAKKKTAKPGDDRRQAQPPNLILLGDFNIFDSKNSGSMNALANNGFRVPDQISGKHTNKLKNKNYDQIAFYEVARRFQATNGGVFDYYESVFSDKYADQYYEMCGGKGKFDSWRTFQMSDHLVLWTELQIDFSKNYLATVLRSSKAARDGEKQGTAQDIPPANAS
jgi:endonuclease/exonuclease/phosphatase family metal-dependent hydrolase